VDTLTLPSVPFALGTFSDPGHAAFPGLITASGRVFDLRQALPWAPGDIRAVLQRWDAAWDALCTLADDRSRSWRSVSDLRIHAPVAPLQIFQSGANYRQHVIDLKLAERRGDDPRPADQVRAEIGAMMDARARDGHPYVFIGLPTSLSGPFDDVELPRWVDQPDWELELVAVIGRPAHRLAPEQALDVVAGYTIANDLTDRASVFRRDMPAIGTDWLRCKNSPGFTPLGPYVVPAAFVDNPGTLRVTLTLNGQVMQDESTKDMIFDVARLVSYVSGIAQLLPGDLVLTGSPAGNGIHLGRLLRVGDVMEGTITWLGGQRTRCVAERGGAR